MTSLDYKLSYTILISPNQTHPSSFLNINRPPPPQMLKPIRPPPLPHSLKADSSLSLPLSFHFSFIRLLLPSFQNHMGFSDSHCLCSVYSIPTPITFGLSSSFVLLLPPATATAATTTEDVVRCVVPSLSSGNFVFLFPSLLIFDFG